MFCEKPLGVSAPVVAEMVDVVERAGIVNQVGLVLRAVPRGSTSAASSPTPRAGRLMAVTFHDDQVHPDQGRLHVDVAGRTPGAHRAAGASGTRSTTSMRCSGPAARSPRSSGTTTSPRPRPHRRRHHRPPESPPAASPHSRRCGTTCSSGPASASSNCCPSASASPSTATRRAAFGGVRRIARRSGTVGLVAECLSRAEFADVPTIDVVTFLEQADPRPGDAVPRRRS